MYPEKDFWFYLAVGVSVTAMFAWAFSSVTGLGSVWVPWVALVVFVLAIGGIGFRGWLQAKSVVWTEEMRAGQRNRTRRELVESIPLFLFGIGSFILNRLSLDGVLPAWVGCILWVALAAGAISLWRVIRRSSVTL